MARIISYSDDQTVSLEDRLLGSDYNDLNKTKEFRIGDILNFFQEEIVDLNYSNDSNAAIGGVAVGRLYHTDGVVKIRLV